MLRHLKWLDRAGDAVAWSTDVTGAVSRYGLAMSVIAGARSIVGRFGAAWTKFRRGPTSFCQRSEGATHASSLCDALRLIRHGFQGHTFKSGDILRAQILAVA
jgi:hypothetical protein